MTVDQPTPAPTNKLTASLIGMVIGSIAYHVAERVWPWLAEIQIAGVGSVELGAQIIVAGALGWFVRDRANV